MATAPGREAPGILMAWDVASGRILQSTPGPDAYIQAVAFLPDRLRVLCGGWGGLTQSDPLKVWDAPLPGR